MTQPITCSACPVPLLPQPAAPATATTATARAAMPSAHAIVFQVRPLAAVQRVVVAYYRDCCAGSRKTSAPQHPHSHIGLRRDAHACSMWCRPWRHCCMWAWLPPPLAPCGAPASAAALEASVAGRRGMAGRRGRRSLSHGLAACLPSCLSSKCAFIASLCPAPVQTSTRCQLWS